MESVLEIGSRENGKGSEDLKASQKKRIKKMASSQVVNPASAENQESASAGIYKGKVSKTIKDAFDGKEKKKSATYELPVARDIDEMLSMCKNDNEEVIFWCNFGRRIAARNQVTASLTQTFADEKLNDLHRGFENALESMLQGSKDSAKIQRYKNFILNEDQYAPLKEAYATLGTDKEDVKHFNFAEIELRKPSNTPGRKAKSKDDSDESDSDE